MRVGEIWEGKNITIHKVKIESIKYVESLKDYEVGFVFLENNNWSCLDREVFVSLFYKES